MVMREWKEGGHFEELENRSLEALAKKRLSKLRERLEVVLPKENVIYIKWVFHKRLSRFPIPFYRPINSHFNISPYAGTYVHNMIV